MISTIIFAKHGSPQRAHAAVNPYRGSTRGSYVGSICRTVGHTCPQTNMDPHMGSFGKNGSLCRVPFQIQVSLEELRRDGRNASRQHVFIIIRI